MSAAALAVTAALTASTCFGTVGHGRLENGVQLPAAGANFAAYSLLGPALGRNYLHSTVHDIVLAAYAQTAVSMPGKVFVYGETGWANGGSIRPHRTHQNGTSADFFVPVVDAAGRSVPLPTSALNKFGYDIEFDAAARYEGLTIDFPALGEHLFQLQAAAEARGAPIALVIFDPRFMQRLFHTRHGLHLKQTLNFMPKDAWVRHDEHYHVDFKVKCAAMSG